MKKGLVAISTMLLLAVVLVAIAATIAMTSIGEAQTSLSLYEGESGLALAEGCAEDLLLKVWENSAYAGTTVTRPEGTCTFVYTSSGPTDWDVTVSTNYTNNPRKIRVVFTRGSSIILTSWQEI